MTKSVRSRFVFIIALIRSFVNDVIRKQKLEVKTAPAEGVYRQGNYPSPKPLWRTWWEEKHVALKLFRSKAYKVGKTSVKVVLTLSLLCVVFGGLYVGCNRDKEVEAVIKRVSWSCNGYIEVTGDHGESRYVYSKALSGEGRVAKCPQGPSDDWDTDANSPPMYVLTFFVELTYPHGGYANETITFQFHNRIDGDGCRCLNNQNIEPGTHWKVKRRKTFFWKGVTQLIRPLPQPEKTSK